MAKRKEPPVEQQASEHTTKQEIPKAERVKCGACGLVSVSTMIVGGKCVNEVACRKRAKKVEARNG